MSQICTTELLSERVVRNDLLLVNDFKNFEMELTNAGDQNQELQIVSQLEKCLYSTLVKSLRS